ncbi:MAG: hypothetical protein OEY28_02295 [Nitrospira sp.]|nr:hypothetical protein [Nitrospira sp.]
MGMSAIVARVHNALERLGTDCAMEEVVGLCPELTWNQVFLAIDYLSRTGEVRITRDTGSTYRVRASHVGTPKASYVSPAH